MSVAATEQAFLLVEDVSTRWRVSDRAVRDAIGRGGLRAAKVAGQWLIRPADVEAYEQARLNVKPAKKRTRAPRRRT